MGNNTTVTAEFLQEKTTKRMVRFYEVDNGSGEKLTGIIYISQTALKKIGYVEGQTLTVTVGVKK